MINIGGEGQIAVGGIAAAFVALSLPSLPALVLIPTALAAGGLAGALWAGIAGFLRIFRNVHEVLGTLMLIEGFSTGFGFNAVAIALLAGLEPAAVLPAGLFFGFLEAGALAMQREVGVPSSLVFVIEGLTMVFVLCAMGLQTKRRRV